jgi:hypothetical protein
MDAGKLADQVTRWSLDWAEAAEMGLCDGVFGARYRAGLERFLAMSESQREAWLGRPDEWRVRRAELDGTEVAVPRAVTREERWRADVEMVTRKWGADALVIGEEVGDRGVTMGDLMESLTGWLAFTTWGERGLPGAKGMHREVVAAYVTGRGGRWVARSKLFTGVRLSNR